MIYALVPSVRRQNLIQFTGIYSLSLVLIALFPLLIGGAVYVLWRAPSLLMFKWANFFGITPYVDLMRSMLGDYKDRLPGWLLYSWPDAAWSMSGVLFFAWIWRGSRSYVRHFWILLTPCMAIASEFAQSFGLLPGTFDPVDLVACCLAAFAGILAACRFYAYEL